MRTKVIAGNWKMNKTPAEAAEFIMELKESVKGIENEIIAAVPFVCIPAALTASEGSNIKIAAQNMHWEEKGAYTGEISGAMLKDLGIEYVIIGHSERREYFAETDETVNLKAHAAFKNGLKPIICVGETLEEREAGKTAEVVIRQTNGAFEGIDKAYLKRIVVAYEPVWAIGTGKTATAQEANDTIAIIRKAIRKLYGKTAANAMRIQYGGSMNAKNATELMSMPEIDGGLIGGASLKAEDFSKVVNY